MILKLLLVHLAYAFVSDYVQEQDRSRYRAVIIDSQNRESYLFEDSLTSTVYAIEALDILQADIPQINKICAALKRRAPKKDDVFQYFMVVAKLKCEQANLPGNLREKLQKALSKPRFTSLYLAVTSALALIDAGKLNESELDFSVVSDTLDQLFDDAGLVRETPRDNSGTPYKTSQAMVLITKLTTRFPDLDLSNPISNLKTVAPELVNSGKKTSGQLVFQGSLTATVSVLVGLSEFGRKFEMNLLAMNSVNRLGKYIVSNKYTETVTGARMVLLGTQYLVSNPFYNPVSVSVNNPALHLDSDDGSRFTVGLQTLGGESVTPDTLIATSVTNKESGAVLLENQEFTQNRNGQYELDLRSVITTAGLFVVSIDLAVGEENASINREIRALQDWSDVKALMYDFNKRQGASKVADEDKTRLVYGKSTKKTAKVSLSGVREARLEAVTKGVAPEQAHAMFTYQGDCEVYQVCSFNVAGTVKSRKFQWRIDLNKSPYKEKMMDGTYSVTLLLAGLFVKDTIRWDVSTIDVVMPVEDDEGKDYEPVDDPHVYFHAREPIAHTFSNPPTQPNSLLALVFTAIVIAPLFTFLILLDKVTGRRKVNISFNGTLFQMSVCVMVFLIVGYWFALNLFQALNLAVFALGATFFFGYQTMKEINAKGGFQD